MSGASKHNEENGIVPGGMVWRMPSHDAAKMNAIAADTRSVKLLSHARPAPFLASESKATPRGFEPLRAEPNGFLVHRLNHSATVSWRFGKCNAAVVGNNIVVFSDNLVPAARSAPAARRPPPAARRSPPVRRPPPSVCLPPAFRCPSACHFTDLRRRRVSHAPGVA